MEISNAKFKTKSTSAFLSEAVFPMHAIGPLHGTVNILMTEIKGPKMLFTKS